MEKKGIVRDSWLDSSHVPRFVETIVCVFSECFFF